MVQLALPPRVWQRDLPQLARSGQRGVAELTRFETEDRTELIASDLRTVASPRGKDFGIYDQLLLVQVEPQVGPHSADRLLTQFSPGHSQWIVALVLGVGDAAGRWSVRMWKYGELLDLESFRLVGPGMRVISSTPPAPAPARDYWSRTQGALGERTFQRVRASRVALIGASRNGSVAAHVFAMLGVERLVLIDPDREELHNLSATLGATPDGVGDWKVHNRAATLRRLRPNDFTIETFNRPFPDRTVEKRLNAIGIDLICTCVDGDLPRLAAATWANQHCVPHLDIGSGIFHADGADPNAGDSSRVMGADIRLCLPGECCVACLGGLQQMDEARRLLRSPPGVLPSTRRRAWHEVRAGSLPTLNSVAVNLGMQLWLDLLAERVSGSRWLHVEWGANGTPDMEYLTGAPGQCTICRVRRP